MASIDKRGKGYRARVRIPGFKPKSRTFDSRQEAKAWAEDTENKLRDGEDAVPNLKLERTLGEALEKYLEEVTPGKKGRVQEERRIRAWQRRKPLTDLKLSKLKSHHFKAFKKERSEEGAASNTIRLDLTLISSLYKTAKEDWDMPYLQNPIAGMQLPKQGKARNRRLGAEEWVRFNAALNACQNRLVKPVTEFALETAARQSEILGLTKGAVDLEKRFAVLRDTKNGTDRVIPLSQRAVEVLRQLEPSAGPYVFPISRNALVSAWRRILQRARITDFRFHDLRHEGTSALFERGLEVMEVQRITGHKTLKTLLDYTHMNPTDVVDRLDETEGRSARSTRRRAARTPKTAGLTAAKPEHSNPAPVEIGKRCLQVPPLEPQDLAAAQREWAVMMTDAKQPPKNVIAFPKRR